MQIGRPYIDGPRSQIVTFKSLIYYSKRVDKLAHETHLSDLLYYYWRYSDDGECENLAFLCFLVIGQSTFTIVIAEDEWFWASGMALMKMDSSMIEHLD